MSTRTINYSRTVNNVLTDAISVFARDVSNTFGVRRSDNGAVVVSAGTAFTRISTGLYNLIFTEPVSGLTYEYSVQVNDTNGFVQFVTGTLLPLAGGSIVPVSVFFTYQQFINRFGEKNVAISSNKDNKPQGPTGTYLVNYAAVQDAWDYASDEILNFFRGGAYVLPFDFTPTGGRVPPILSRWAMTTAYYDLYTDRGMEDTNKRGNKMTRLIQAVYDDMAQYKNATLKRLNVGYLKGNQTIGRVFPLDVLRGGPPQTIRYADGVPVLIPWN